MIPRRQTLGYYEFDASEEGKGDRYDDSPSQSLICAQRREENRARRQRESGASVVRVGSASAPRVGSEPQLVGLPPPNA